MTGTRTGTGTFFAWAATGCAALALVLDLSGPVVWGGRLAPAAIVLAALAAALLGRRGLVFWVIAVALLALARWLRGSAGVPPDSPLLVMQLIAVLLMLWRAWRSRWRGRGVPHEGR